MIDPYCGGTGATLRLRAAFELTAGFGREAVRRAPRCVFFVAMSHSSVAPM